MSVQDLPGSLQKYAKTDLINIKEIKVTKKKWKYKVLDISLFVKNEVPRLLVILPNPLLTRKILSIDIFHVRQLYILVLAKVRDEVAHLLFDNGSNWS